MTPERLDKSVEVRYDGGGQDIVQQVEGTVCAKAGGGTVTWGLVGHVRQLNLDPARSGKPPGVFRQVDDVTDTNMLTYKPTHTPDTSPFSPTHTSHSCQASHLHPHPQSHTHPLAPPGRAAENPVPASSKSVRRLPHLFADFVEQDPLV